MIAQLGPQRRDVRSQSAGSLVGSVVLAGVAAYVLSKQMDAAEQVRLERFTRTPVALLPAKRFGQWWFVPGASPQKYCGCRL